MTKYLFAAAMTFLLAALLVLIPTFGLKSQTTDEIPFAGILITPEPIAISGGVICDTLELVKQVTQNMNDPVPAGCVIIAHLRPVLALIYAIEKVITKDGTFQMVRYVITAAATPIGNFPFVDAEGNPATIIKWGWWGFKPHAGA